MSQARSDRFARGLARLAPTPSEPPTVESSPSMIPSAAPSHESGAGRQAPDLQARAVGRRSTDLLDEAPRSRDRSPEARGALDALLARGASGGTAALRPSERSSDPTRALGALLARAASAGDAIVVPDADELGTRRVSFSRPVPRPDRVESVAPLTPGTLTPVVTLGPAAAELESLERPERIQRLRSLLDAFVARSAPVARRALPRAPPPAIGEPLDQHGFARALRQYLEPAHCHGRSPVRGALEIGAHVVAALARDARLGDFDPRRMLILDTETTGLAGGTGTLPFLVGLARFEDESLALEQLLVCRPGHELPALVLLKSRIESATSLVTYNGKSFDWPILRNRFVMNRIAPPECPPHLDLLHISRKVFRARLESAKLVRVEEGVLGFVRHDDVLGSAIPQLYWSFVREGDPKILEKVLEHNSADVVALAALLGVLGAAYESPRSAFDPRDLLGLAEIAFDVDDYERALRFAEVAESEPTIAYRAKRLAAKAATRTERVELAVSRLEEASALAPNTLERTETDVALAKLLEHKLKSLEAALEVAKRVPDSGDDSARRRVQRLEVKIERRRRKQLARAVSHSAANPIQ